MTTHTYFSGFDITCHHLEAYWTTINNTRIISLNDRCESIDVGHARLVVPNEFFDVQPVLICLVRLCVFFDCTKAAERILAVRCAVEKHRNRVGHAGGRN